MKALGCDPGPSKTALSLLMLDENGWPSVVAGGHYENGSPELRRLVQLAAMERAVVGIESAVTSFSPKNTMQIIETARVEGRLAQLAEGFGAKVIMLEARTWRGELCGSPTASDEQIRIAIEGLCRTLPRVKADARPHVYDATGVALAALARELGRTVSVPASVMGAVHLQREAERAKRSARTAAGLPAVVEAKRSPTRAQSKRRSEASKRSWAERKAGA